MLPIREGKYSGGVYRKWICENCGLKCQTKGSTLEWINSSSKLDEVMEELQQRYEINKSTYIESRNRDEGMTSSQVTCLVHYLIVKGVI